MKQLPPRHGDPLLRFDHLLAVLDLSIALGSSRPARLLYQLRRMLKTPLASMVSASSATRALPASRATRLGERKMPLPMIKPTMSAADAPIPRRRGSVPRCSRRSAAPRPSLAADTIDQTCSWFSRVSERVANDSSLSKRTVEVVTEIRWDESAGLQAGCDKLPVTTRSRRNRKGDRRGGV